MLPEVSICLHVRNRLSFLIPCVESILAQRFKNFELVIIDYACREGSYDYITANYRDERLRVIRYDDTDRPWSMSLCKNLAIVNCTAPVVVLADCDNIFDPDFLLRHYHAFRDESRSFYFGGAQHPSHRTIMPYGLIMLRKEDFLEAGGFNQFCTYGWGREDVDFTSRLCDLGLECKGFLDLVSATPHSDEIRNKEARVKSLVETNNLNFIASNIGLVNFAGERSFYPRFTQALRESEYFADAALEVTSVENIALAYHEYTYNKYYPNPGICCFLYTLRVKYRSNGTEETAAVGIFSHIRQQPYARYRSDARNYLTFDHVFRLDAGPGGREAFEAFKTDLHRKVLQQVFGRTIALLEKHQPEIVSNYLAACDIGKNQEETNGRFGDFLETEINRLEGEEGAPILDVYLLENNVFLHAQRALILSEAQQVEIAKAKQETASLTDEELLDAEFVLSDSVIFHRTRWNWNVEPGESPKGSFNASPFGHVYLINNYNAVTRETLVAPELQRFLYGFTRAGSVKNVMQGLVTAKSPYAGRLSDNNTAQLARSLFDADILIDPKFKRTVAHALVGEVS
ncbi:MAG: glycosyltransferase family 2 protein [Cytophagales bacterium]|nr:glycosyltransferase family 2 protein [Cytophagales bacterium]